MFWALTLGKSQTPIVPVIIGEEKTTREFARRIRKHGIFAMPITYPTVKLGTARIRLMNSAIHSKEDLDKTIKAFSTLVTNLILFDGKNSSHHRGQR